MRVVAYLKSRYAAILSAIGMILSLCSIIVLLPLLGLFANPEESVNVLAFILPAFLLAFFGGLLRHFFKFADDITLSVQEGGVIVLVSWVIVILFCAWPFIAILDISFSRAVFESVSGWTTTGLSVVDVTSAGPLILLFRSIIQLAGGAGLAIIMMSAIVGPAGVGVSSAEGRNDQLVPHVRQSARLVLMIYGLYAVSGTVAYWLAGMSFFDAINHSFSAVSTGGFSTKAESIGYWNSAAIEAVTLPLMLLGNLSFVSAWFLFSGQIRTFFKNGEVRLQMLLIPLCAVLIFVLVAQTLYPQLDKAVRVSIFETVSALTTTGFSTVSYGDWNAFGFMLLVVLMLIGGGTCSTAGGIKQFRIFLVFKMLIWDIKRYLMPTNAVVENQIREGNQRVFINSDRFRQVAVFIFLYLFVYVLGSLLLCSYGYNLRESLFEFASALGTVGLSVGVTSSQMPDGVLWAQIFAMLLGRLEFFVVIVSLFKLGNDFHILISHKA